MRNQLMKKRLAYVLATAVLVSSSATFASDNNFEHIVDGIMNEGATQIEVQITTDGALIPGESEEQLQTIAQIREEMYQGTQNKKVKFKGVVTRKDAMNMYVQDDEAGMYIYGSPKGDAAEIGDEIIIEATTTIYNNLLEVKDATLKVVSSAHVVSPLELTIAEYLEAPQKYESFLIEFKDVKLGKINSGGATPIEDETGRVDIFKIPANVVAGFDSYDVVAVGARYRDTNQLTVVEVSDVKPVEGMSNVSDIVIKKGESFTLPTVTVAQGGVLSEVAVEWNKEEIDAVDINKIGTYKVSGTLDGRTFTMQVIVISEEGIKISDIQGKSHTSPFVDKIVTGIKGIVTAMNGTSGFYIQSLEEDMDSDDATSEGIYVAASSSNTKKVSVGNVVTVDGKVEEKLSDSAQLSVTQLYSSKVDVVSKEGNKPEPIIIGEGGRIPPNTVVDNDSFGVFDPEEDSIDFYESLEGMLVQINDAQVVGATGYGQIPVVPDRGSHSMGLISPQGGVVITEETLHPEIMMLAAGQVKILPDVEVGDVFAGEAIGVMSYSGSVYKMLLSEELPGIDYATYDKSPVTTLNETENGLRIASFNVENLGGDEEQEKYDRIGEAIAKNLLFPDIIGLEEVQDNDGADDTGEVAADVVYKRIIEAIEAQEGAEGITYDYVEIAPVDKMEGGQPGGNIRVGMIYRTDRVSIVESERGDATTETQVVKNKDGSASLSLNPGRLGTSSDDFKDTRKSLAVEFMFKGEKVFVIANHFSSKGGDEAIYGSNQPAVLHSEVYRNKQAQLVNQFVKGVLAVDPMSKVVVLGDMNDYYFSNPLKSLEGKELYNMHYKMPENERYTYIYQGRSQVLDNILVTKGLEACTEVDIININTMYSGDTQLSDHDPIIISIDMSRANEVLKPVVPPTSDDDSSSISGGGSSSKNELTGITIKEEDGRVNVALTDAFAREQLKDEKISNIVFETKKDEKYMENVTLELSTSLMKILNENKKGFVIKAEQGEIIVPVDFANEKVVITLKKVDTSAEQVVEAMPTARTALGGYEFTVKIAGKDAETLQKEVQMAFDVPKNVNAQKLGVYILQDHKWQYVGGKLQNGKIVVNAVNVGQMILAESHQTFNDIQKHWAQEEIEILAAKHLVVGVEEEIFAPKAEIKSGDFATVLTRLVGHEVTTHEASKKLTRAQMAVMLKEAMGSKETAHISTLQAFKDVQGSTEGEKEALAYMVEMGILFGQDQDTMAPNATLTRAEMAAVIIRTINLQ